MPTNLTWTTEVVLNLAPNLNSANAGRALAIRGAWSQIASSEKGGNLMPAFSWGVIRGSGKEPYRVNIDWREPAYSCSCPSRNYPCKHALGLMLLLVEESEVFSLDQPPNWAAEWQARRREKTDAAQKGKPKGTDVNEKATASQANKVRRAARREKRAEDGMAALEVWLHDLINQGLAAARSKPAAFWEGIATRMVDAQLPGLARRIRDLDTAVNSSDNWQETALHHLASLHLVVKGYQNFDTLPSNFQAELRNQIGHAPRQADLADLPGESGCWQVLASRSESLFAGERDRSHILHSRRTWLLNVQTRKPGLMLEFTPAHLPFGPAYPAGIFLTGEAVYYPGLLPLRLFFRSVRAHSVPDAVDGLSIGDIPWQESESAWTSYIEKVAQNPWLGSLPLLLKDVIPVVKITQDQVSCWIVDHQKSGISWPVDLSFEKIWELAALSGGNPIKTVGEWDGRYFWPLRVQQGSQWVELT